MTAILLIIISYLLLLWDFIITFSIVKKTVKIEHNELIWVGLDYLLIWKYKSDDTPIKWFKINIINIKKNSY